MRLMAILSTLGIVILGLPTRTSALSLDKAIVLILDVDNTLYTETLARQHGPAGVEEQIISNGYIFFEKLGITPEQAEELHRKYSSSIEGLKATSNQPDDIDERFYREVYSGIDMSCLSNSHTGSGSTGYSHTANQESRRRLLERIPCPLYLASNSPSYHVNRVIDHLGLSHIPWKGILTPDQIEGYPTKTEPRVYFASLLEKYHPNNLVLLDDSKHNVEKARQCGMKGIQIGPGCSLDQALALVLGHVDPEYEFSDHKYLESKNVVDAQAIHTQTWKKVAEHIELEEEGGGILRIVDVGAGLLSMLEMILVGKGDKSSLVSMVTGDVKQVDYHAYESNVGLFAGCCETLQRLGFQPESELVPAAGQIYVFRKDSAVVRLELQDYSHSNQRERKRPHLIVGCCFADLMDPVALVQSLLRFVASFDSPSDVSPLLYFPITFAGITQLLPARAFERNVETNQWIPSDTVAFKLYSEALESLYGHNLSPARLVSAVRSHGGRLLHQGPSNWVIDPTNHYYLWNTMLYFFGTVAAPALLQEGWDSAAWIQRTRKRQATIMVSNHDLLFRLNCKKEREACNVQSENPKQTSESLEIEEISFNAPYEVGTRKHSLDTQDGVHLGLNDVEVESVCSLISSGTELKIFKGLFDDAALDVNIDAMADERMAYPLSYGYSLVGRVTRCGKDVKDRDELVGKLVFTFSPHSSHVIADRNSLQLVPDGIKPEDAIFVPSVETALSLVHDANVRVGEKVAVYGQGLIGLLVTSILEMQKGTLDSATGDFGTVTAFDTIPDRLAAAAAMGASQALHPSEVAQAGPFDVSIEVSGNGRALQSAIDHTSDGGRVVVGSWYGNKDVVLKLGIDFHRSHKTIKTSQVSEIPAELRGLWTKERRFDLTWNLVKLLKPSRLITRQTALSNAQEAYNALDGGEEIAIAFIY